MHRAKALAGAKHCRQGFLRGFGRIHDSGRSEAIVAIAASFAGFAEVIEQAHAAASGGFSQTDQGIELDTRHPLEGVVGLRLLDHAALLNHVRQPVGHPCIRRLSIAAGATGFLIIGFDALGQVEMRNKANVGFVDAHAERDGGSHHHAFAVDKTGLVARPYRRIQSGVIRQGIDAARAKPGRGFLDLLARKAVDDAGIPRMPAFDEIEQLVARSLLFNHRVADVRTIEARNKDPGVL